MSRRLHTQQPCLPSGGPTHSGLLVREGHGQFGASMDSIFPAITVINATLSSPHYPVFTTLPEKQKPASKLLPTSQAEVSIPLSECREKKTPQDPPAAERDLRSLWLLGRVCGEIFILKGRFGKIWGTNIWT